MCPASERITAGAGHFLLYVKKNNMPKVIYVNGKQFKTSKTKMLYSELVRMAGIKTKQARLTCSIRFPDGQGLSLTDTDALSLIDGTRVFITHIGAQ